MTYTVSFADPSGIAAGSKCCETFAEAQEIADEMITLMPAHSQVYITHPDGSETSPAPR